MLKWVLLGAFVLIVSVGCGTSSAPEPTATAIPAVTELNGMALISKIERDLAIVCGEDACPTEVGEVLYHYKGCASCHGSSGEGSSVALALKVLTKDEVKLQVRHPKGAMPAFTEAQINEDELNLLALYVTSLNPNSEYWVWSEP